MEQSSPGFRLSPWWPILIGSDLSNYPMHEKYNCVIGAKPDGELIQLSRTGNRSTGPSYKIERDIIVGPNDLFNASSIREHPTFTHEQEDIITRLVERLKEQGVANLNRKARNYGYKTIELTAEEFHR